MVTDWNEVGRERDEAFKKGMEKGKEMTDKQIDVIEPQKKRAINGKELRKEKWDNVDKEKMVLHRRIMLQRRELRRLNRRMFVLKLRVDNAALENKIAVSQAYRNAAELAECYDVKGSHRIADAIRKWI